MVKVIVSDFQLNDRHLKTLNWQIVNLTSILINRDVHKLVDLTGQTIMQSSQFESQLQVTTIDLSNDLNEYLQPLHLKNYLSLSDDDLFNENLYYWQAPEQYVGGKLYSYGNELQFKLAYSVLRGDVASNKCNYEQDADVVMAGLIENRLQFIGLKWTRYQSKFRCDVPITIRVRLREQFWYRLDHRFKLTNQTVDRLRFARILNSLRLILIRASYHSDQIEARLYTVTMGITDPEMEVKVPFQAKLTEKCDDCAANSDGLFCERCKPGFYGNPIVDDYCKPCKCPGALGSAYHANGCKFDSKRNRPICQVSLW